MITTTPRPNAGRQPARGRPTIGRPRRTRVRFDRFIRTHAGVRPWSVGHRILTLAILAYVGGAVMFSVHALIRGEKGPPISNLDHWLLDSSLGFVALAPVVIIGIAVLARFVPPWSIRFPIVAGIVFAVLTTPGPIVHDLAVGEDTVGANLATHFCGLDPVTMLRPEIEHTAQSECLVQLLVGIPTYVGLFLVAWGIGRAWRARRPVDPPEADFLRVPGGIASH